MNQSVDINAHINELKALLNNYLTNEFKFITSNAPDCIDEDFIKRKVFFSLAIKAKSTTSWMSENSDRAQKVSADIRGLLETLIIAKLCEKDSRYILAMVISNFSRELDYVQALQECISKSASRLDEIYELDKNLFSKQLKNKEKLEGFTKNSLPHSGALGMYDLDGLINGFGFTAKLARKQILPLYDQEIKNIENREILYFNKISTAPFFLRHFPNVTHSKDVKTAVDTYLQNEKVKEWKQKALKAGLADDYASVYKITSDSIHVTSISLFTKDSLSDGEVDFYLRMTYAYLREVISILNSFNPSAFNISIK